MSDAQVAEVVAKAKKAEPVQTEVTMQDGRKVIFVGKRKMLKEATHDANHAGVRFDFVNGESRTVKLAPGDALFHKFAAHGIAQKIGDETAGEESVDDMVLAVDSILGRLGQGEWGAERKAGDGFSGASTVVRAIMEATGKDQTFVKAFLERKLESGKESGLTRQKLYASFRAPGTKTAPIIEKLEREKLAGKPAIDANAELDAMLS